MVLSFCAGRQADVEAGWFVSDQTSEAYPYG